ncbi:MAG: hypothetical protein QXI58_01925, partial [Candidatus Micrarchaeia archaeon]
TLVLTVDEEDNMKVSKQFSVVSQKLAAELEPFLLNNTYLNYDFIIIKDAPGPVAPRILEIRQRGK